MSQPVTKRVRLRGGMSAKVKYSQCENGKWRVTSISDAKSARGAMPLDFLPFEVSNLVYGRVDFDDEVELTNCLEGLSR